MLNMDLEIKHGVKKYAQVLNGGEIVIRKYSGNFMFWFWLLLLLLKIIESLISWTNREFEIIKNLVLSG
jgi:hypothetical protein